MAAIQSVYEFRALTTEQIAALHFRTKAGRTHCQTRLKLLYHHGYLFRDEQPIKLTEGRRPLVYFLDRKGEIQEIVICGPMAEALLRARIQTLLEDDA